MHPNFIVTLRLDAELQDQLTKLRAKYFPPERNYLEAHVTLFHALPGAEMATWRPDLEKLALQTASFEIIAGQPYSLGRGVALKIEARELPALHHSLQQKWQSFLSPQDLQKRRAHCTIQNKVEPPEARFLLDHLNRSFDELAGVATGFSLFRYAGGPWEFEAKFDFKGACP